MRYDSIADLKGRITRVMAQHQSRRDAHDLDHSLWRLDSYVLEELRHNSRLKRENYPAFTSNAPRTLSRAVMAMLNKNRPRLRILTPPDVSEEESDTINANERLLEGAMYENDLVRGRRGDNNMQYEITWYIAHRGGVILRPLVLPDARVTNFPVDVYDPYECSWDEGYDGLLFFVRHYREDRNSVLDRFTFAPGTEPTAVGDNEVEMFDVWWIEKDADFKESELAGELAKDYGEGADEANKVPDADAEPMVFNCVIAGDRWAKNPTWHKEFDHIPLYAIRAGGTPSRTAQAAGESISVWRADQWESIYTAVRSTIGWINRIATLYSLYLRDGAIGPWVYKGGRNKQLGAPKAFTTIRIAPGEEFGPVGMPQMASEAKEMLGFIQQEWQKAGVSEIVFGNTPFTVSGFGMLQLKGAVEALIGGYVRATEASYTFIAHELTEQFVTVGGRRKFSVKGTDRRGKVFMQNIKPKDISKIYVPQVTLKDGVPDDPIAKGNAAQMWKAAGAPSEQIFEQIFEADDAGEWAREARREKVESLPEVLMLEGITDLLRAGKKQAAALLMQMFQASGGLAPQGQPGQPTQPQNRGTSSETAGFGEQSGNFGGGGRPPQGQ